MSDTRGSELSDHLAVQEFRTSVLSGRPEEPGSIGPMSRCLVVLVLIACGSTQAPPAPPPPPTPTPQPAAPAPAPPPAAAGLDLAGMDRGVKPGDDFYRFANGGWLARTEIPADRSSYSTSMMLTEVTAKRVAELIRDAA